MEKEPKVNSNSETLVLSDAQKVSPEISPSAADELPSNETTATNEKPSVAAEDALADEIEKITGEAAPSPQKTAEPESEDKQPDAAEAEDDAPTVNEARNQEIQDVIDASEETPSLAEEQATKFVVRSEAEDAAADLEMSPVFAYISNGSEEPKENPMKKKKPETVEEQMKRLGYPPRPHLWPKVMSWPVRPQFDMLVKHNPDPDKCKVYYDMLEQLEFKMLEQAREIHNFIMEHNDPRRNRDNRFMGIPYRRKLDKVALKNMRRHGDDPHYGIRWASLLDTRATLAASNMVQEWGHAHARTKDNGEVRVDKNGIRFLKPSPLAIQLAVHEGMARGWGEFKMGGTPEFTKTALEVARAANVRATITEHYGPFYLYKRVHHVTPTPPGADGPAKVKTVEETPQPQEKQAVLQPTGPSQETEANTPKVQTQQRPKQTAPMPAQNNGAPELEDPGYGYEERDYVYDESDFSDRGHPHDDAQVNAYDHVITDNRSAVSAFDDEMNSGMPGMEMS